MTLTVTGEWPLEPAAKYVSLSLRTAAASGQPEPWPLILPVADEFLILLGERVLDDGYLLWAHSPREAGPGWCLDADQWGKTVRAWAREAPKDPEPMKSRLYPIVVWFVPPGDDTAYACVDAFPSHRGWDGVFDMLLGRGAIWLTVLDPWVDVLANPGHGPRLISWMRHTAFAARAVPVAWAVEPPWVFVPDDFDE